MPPTKSCMMPSSLGHTQNDLCSVGHSRWYGRDMKTTLKSITLKFWEIFSKTQRRMRNFLTIWGVLKQKIGSKCTQECVFCIKAPPNPQKKFASAGKPYFHIVHNLIYIICTNNSSVCWPPRGEAGALFSNEVRFSEEYFPLRRTTH